ncbi:hypothetical protein BCR33DRAFT_853050 [Rhizoclosmatium globosum]|uniref:Arrestin C-terminal-like domain-containing protein n=1 Tax=Rhizoclosmatium globosum TaxID=329046 RepID=A0A1Y2BYT7_9FUNG|nr:hypothetical protein BCR33DRAFT_853050 [Rhizoclosmatium globosum]|eukprot:ORY39921.1 hypothetical protein BCR33DRAFT_853050 [Rhizoclosmatium globosum]
MKDYVKPDVESNDYKVLKHSRIFQQSYDLVYESRDSVFPDPSGSPIAFNFKFKLPRNDMPPSFDHPAGSVIYTLKAIASFYEGRNFSKTTVELEVPMTVIMPESAKLKLLEAPNPMDTFVPATSGMCSYSLQIPKTVLVVGETLVVNLTIGSTPENARLQSVSTSLNIAAGFSTAKTTVGFNHSSTNKEATFARFPRPVGEVLDTFPSLKVGGVGGVEPVVRRYELYIDPEVALPSFGSQLIAINTIFRLQITTDDGIPNVHLEVPVVVLPQAVNRTVVPSNPVNLWSPTSSTTSRTTQPAPSPSASPSLRPTPLPSPAPGMNISSRQYQQVAPLPTQPVYQVVPILRSPPLSPVTSQRSQQTDRVTSLPPSYEETPNTETEIQRLNNEQAKLTELLAEIQRFELSQSPPRTEMLRSELNRIGSQSASMLDGTSSIRCSSSTEFDYINDPTQNGLLIKFLNGSNKGCT